MQIVLEIIKAIIFIDQLSALRFESLNIYLLFKFIVSYDILLELLNIINLIGVLNRFFDLLYYLVIIFSFSLFSKQIYQYKMKLFTLGFFLKPYLIDLLMMN